MTALQAGLVGLVFGSAAFLGGHLLMTGLGQVEGEPATGHPPLWRAVALLGLFAAIEEAVFRAGVLGLGGRFIGFPAALVLSVGLFAAVHRTGVRLAPLAWLNLVLVGTLLGFLFHDWGFWAALGFHWAWNAWEWGLGYAVSGEQNRNHLPSPPRIRRLGAIAYGPEAHWASGAVLGASLLGLLVLHR